VSTQQIETRPGWPAVSGAQMRASDADRDAAISLLNSAFAEGRLTPGEHEERLSAAYAARTWQRLRELTEDLPAPPGATAEEVMPRMPGKLDHCLLCALLIVCPPAGIAWWFLSRRCPSAPRAGRGAAGPGDQRAQDR
jgi:hypothetical protein